MNFLSWYCLFSIALPMTASNVNANAYSSLLKSFRRRVYSVKNSFLLQMHRDI